MASHFHQLSVKEVRKETADCISVAFDIPANLKTAFTFTQGQNITLKAIIDGEELRRSYSVCSSPLDDELRIAVKKVIDGKFSSWANKHLTKGSVIDVLPASGKFYTPLDASSKNHYVGFAAGSGITPLLSIIKTTLLTEPRSSFTLIYGNKNRASIIFKEELEALKNKFFQRFSIHHILSREKTETPLNEGRIDAAKCVDIFKHILDLKTCDDFFICGPQTMIFSVKEWLEQHAVESRKIHFELFTVPGEGKSEAGSQKLASDNKFDDKKANITIKLDGVAFDFTMPYDGDPILDAALKTGADLPFACKGGVCATCRAKLLTGEISMANNYALEPEEIKNGYILTCQSHPRSNNILIDFDVK